MCLLSDLRAKQWLLEWTQIPDVWECGLLQIDVHFPGVQVSNCPVHESKISVFKRKASWVQVYYLHHGSIWGKFRNFKSFHLIAYPCNSWMAFWSFLFCEAGSVGDRMWVSRVVKAWISKLVHNCPTLEESTSLILSFSVCQIRTRFIFHKSPLNDYIRSSL